MDQNRLNSPPSEITPPPEEFPVPAPDAVPPPEEFSTPQYIPAASGRKRRKLLYALAAAAVLLLASGRLRSGPSAQAPQPAPVSVPSASVRPAETPVPTQRATAEPTSAPAVTPEPTAVPTSTPEPTPTPTPSPTATPEPTPAPSPVCDILFYNFSSANHIRLSFTRPEAFHSVQLTLTEPILDLEVDTVTLTPEEIASGEVVLPVYDTGPLYMEHMKKYDAKNAWPETLHLHAVMVYDAGDGETKEERDLDPSPELGWAFRYWEKKEKASEYVFPGCFVFSTYESRNPVALVIDDPGAVSAGTISVSFSIDGQPIEADGIEYKTWDESYKVAGKKGKETFYYARLVVPKPDWAPEKGVAHVAVTQYLEGYGRIIFLEQDLPYSK